MMNFNAYRNEFPIIEDKTFLNHAAISPTPKRVVAALEKLFHEFSHEGLIRYPRWMGRIEEVRRLFANLLGASPQEVAFVGNTSEGLSLVASGLDWKEGDGVMVPVPDFPANLYPWMNLERLGVNVHFVQRRNGRFDVDSLEKALKPGTRLLSISYVMIIDSLGGSAISFQVKAEPLSENLSPIASRNGHIFLTVTINIQDIKCWILFCINTGNRQRKGHGFCRVLSIGFH